MPTKRKRSANIYFKNRRSKSELYLCGDCEYIADCINDFNDHTHSQDEDHENWLFSCNFCNESFKTLGEVMKHNKAIHFFSILNRKKTKLFIPAVLNTVNNILRIIALLVRTVGFSIVNLSKILILVSNVICVKKNSELKLLSENIWRYFILKMYQIVKMKMNVNSHQENVGLFNKKSNNHCI